MNKLLIGIAAGLATALAIWGEGQKKTEKEDKELEERLSASGFQVSSGHRVIRFRGSYESLQALIDPKRVDSKPPLPPDLDVESLPKFCGGCPHCGTRSMYGENQWRYQELSRTRGHWDNTTTYLVKCQKCLGFMRATVDHDD